MQEDLNKKLDKWIGGNIAGAAGEKIGFAKPLPQKKIQPAHPRKFKALRVIPLGGLDEVGKNMMIFEYDQDIVIVDMGLQFPEEDMLGIDYVIPDISYLAGKENRIRAILITHGHLDHIGAIPYLLPKLNFPPIFTTKLTLGFIKKRLEEFSLEKRARMYEIDPKKQMRIGNFTIDWFRVNHSIPDGVGIVLRTPAGTVVHTGDFKFDYTPVFQEPADYTKIAALGSQNVIAMFSDSTNALKPGFTMSEKRIGENIHEIIKNAKGRIIIASFASLIGRIQQIVNSANFYGRKVFLSGRSMMDNVEIARQLAFLKVPPGIIHPINKMGKIKDEYVLILTTGAQGEAMSALTRMALGDHSQVSIKKGDTVVLSSSPIPGNERSIYTVINDLVRLGAHVIFNQVMDVHTSGHAQREDLKLMINLVKPKYLIPVHGELYMRQAHAAIGRELGLPEKNTIVVENGDIMEIAGGEVHKMHEKANANYIMIDGKGIGDVGAQVIMDRQIMAENGMMVVLFTVDSKTKKLLKEPDIISRGFIYMKESQEIMREAIGVAKKAYEEALLRMPQGKRGEIKAFIRGSLDRFSHRKIERHPLVLPVIAEV
ncbi:ribonuclease J [Candidatus Peregrinibacteria bacterium]|nr:ribonuclease J [Candidatus Peregrinibacteria bacterium]